MKIQVDAYQRWGTFGLGLLLCACVRAPAQEARATTRTGAADSSVASAAPPASLSAALARRKLASLSRNRVQLWVVAHVRAHQTLRADGSVDEEKLIARALADADAAVTGGADMVVLINSRCELPLYERVLQAVRSRHPDFPLGISALSYGPKNLTEGFRLAEKFGAQMVWCEVAPNEQFEYEADDGHYVRGEATPRELALRVQQERRPTALHVAGVHMKYTRPIGSSDFGEAMRAALGSVDGINITGPKTGELANLDRLRTARRIAGEYPLGLASGVSVDNIESVLPFVDYVIVGTSLKMPNDPLRLSLERIRALRDKMTSLGGGPS